MQKDRFTGYTGVASTFGHSCFDKVGLGQDCVSPWPWALAAKADEGWPAFVHRGSALRPWACGVGFLPSLFFSGFWQAALSCERKSSFGCCRWPLPLPLQPGDWLFPRGTQTTAWGSGCQLAWGWLVLAEEAWPPFPASVPLLLVVLGLESKARARLGEVGSQACALPRPQRGDGTTTGCKARPAATLQPNSSRRLRRFGVE